MRILSFSHDSNLMGAQRSLIALLEGLKNHGHQVHLVIPGNGALNLFAANSGIKTTSVPYPYPSSRPHRAMRFFLEISSASKKIQQLVAAEKPDLIHYNTAACIAPALALKKNSIKKIWHLRERAPQRELVSKWILSWSDIAVANCEDTFSGYPLLTKNNRIALVHNGIKVNNLDSEGVANLRTKMNWTKEIPVILFAGNLLPHKNPQAIIMAAKILNQRGVKAQFKILGSGILEKQLEEMISESDLESQVELLGFRKNALDYIGAADIIAIPSLVEPFPRTGLEAMSMAKPVIGADVGGMSEQIVHEKTGLLYPAENMDEFANCLENLIVNKSSRIRMGKQGQQRVIKLFSQDVYTSKFLEVAEKLLSSWEEK